MREVKIKDLGKVVSGSTPKSSEPSFWDGDIPWVTPKELGSKTSPFLTQTERSMTEAGYQSCSTKLLPKGSILFTSRAPIGHIAIADVELCTNQGFKSIVLNPGVFPLYIYYALKSKVRHLQNLGTGTTFKELSKAVFEEFRIPVPELDTQIRIAELLYSIDGLIQKRKKSITLLDELLKHTFLDMFGDTHTNERNYPTVNISEAASAIVDCPHSTPSYLDQPSPYPCIRTSEIKNGQIDWSTMRYIDAEAYQVRVERLVPIEGDIVFGREGTVGDATLVPKNVMLSLGQRVMLIRVDKELFDPRYFLALIRSAGVQHKIKGNLIGATVKRINIKDLKEISIPRPPLSLQLAYARIHQEVSDLRERYHTSLAEMVHLTASISQRAFKGELDLSKMSVDHVLPAEHITSISITPQDITEQHRQISKPKSKTDQIKNKLRLHVEDVEESRGQLVASDVSISGNFAIQARDIRSDKIQLESGFSVAHFARLLRAEFKDYHFTAQMLLDYLDTQDIETPPYLTSKELKENRKVDRSQDFKSLIFQGIRGNIKSLNLEQVYYDGVKENFVLKLRDFDYQRTKHLSAKEHSGLYLKFKT